VNPVWPLPRRPGGPSDEEIRNAFANHKLWHYAYEFDGGLSFSARHDESTDARPDARRRPLQRFRHFMPYLLEAQNGSLQGKRVLDIACNTGFWSIQCALLGAKVVGFDARDELVEQANLIKTIVGADNVEFKVLDFWDMSPQALGGTFDVVLNLGLLYHLPNPIEALQLTKSLAREVILLDTEVYRSNEALVKYRWEEPVDIRMANLSGIIAVPSRTSIDLVLKQIGASAWFEIPVRTADMPNDYLIHKRASWLIKV
jgi:2-polyprenyl-3-methyl-5-hydroxy-6-metoxy-1,4-benzoquinol methylase